MKQLILYLTLLFSVPGFSQPVPAPDSLAKTSSRIILEQLLTATDTGNNMVRLETVSFPPLYKSREHRHPCPLFVYVLEGELVSEFEGIKKTYSAGDCFYEKKNGLHSITQNPSPTQSAKILVMYLMNEGMDTFLPVK